MTETPDDEAPEAQQDRVAHRAELLPEEAAAGSADPERQAEEILRDSDERTDRPEATAAASSQTSTPDERPRP